MQGRSLQEQFDRIRFGRLGREDNSHRFLNDSEILCRTLSQTVLSGRIHEMVSTLLSVCSVVVRRVEAERK